MGEVRRSPKLTWSQYRDFVDDISQSFLCDAACWRIEGRPVLPFLNLTDFVSGYGIAAFSAMIGYASEAVSNTVGQRPFVLGIINQISKLNVSIVKYLPLDGVTGYGLLPNWRGDPIQDYKLLISERVRDWDWFQRQIAVPFFPVVGSGWDATSRGAPKGSLQVTDAYPHLPVVHGVTQAWFGYFLDCAVEFNRRWAPRPNVTFLHAWNEWSEGAAIEPSDQFEFSLIDELRRRAVRP